MTTKPLLGPCDSYQNAQKRAEYWKAEAIAASKEIDAMRAVVDAVRCIRHWLDSSNDGLVLTGEHIRALWQALADYDAFEGNDEH